MFAREIFSLGLSLYLTKKRKSIISRPFQTLLFTIKFFNNYEIKNNYSFRSERVYGH